MRMPYIRMYGPVLIIANKSARTIIGQAPEVTILNRATKFRTKIGRPPEVTILGRVIKVWQR